MDIGESTRKQTCTQPIQTTVRNQNKVKMVRTKRGDAKPILPIKPEETKAKSKKYKKKNSGLDCPHCGTINFMSEAYLQNHLNQCSFNMEFQADGQIGLFSSDTSGLAKSRFTDVIKPIEVKAEPVEPIFVKTEPEEDSIGIREDTTEPKDPLAVKQESDGLKTVKVGSIVVPIAAITQVEYTCEQCSAKFSSQADRNNHLHSQHNVKFLHCKVCKKAFLSPDEFKNHEHDAKTAESDGNLQCEFCQKFYQSMMVLRGHYLRQHNQKLSFMRRPKPPGQIPCNQCDRKFRSRQSVDYHIRSVHEGFRASCDLCGKTFCNEQSRRKHKINCGTL